MKTRIFISSIVILISIVGCNSAAPKRNFADFDLLIRVNDMPKGWVGAEISENDPNNSENAENKALRYFYFPNTQVLVKAGETVYRYKNEFYARNNYSRFEKDYFSQTSNDITPWQTPTDVIINKPSAAQWHFSCANSNFMVATNLGNQRKICQYLGQYDEFLIYFSITTEVDNNKIISNDELANLIEKIDKKIKGLMSSTTLTNISVNGN